MRNIDARGWELHLRHPNNGDSQNKRLSHDRSFIRACQAGELELVKAVVERSQVGLEARGAYSETPLHLAAENGRIPVVQYLCEQGAVMEATSAGDATPLLMAASIGDLSTVQYLCKQGADEEARGDIGKTTLHWTAVIGHLAVVQYLCEQDTDKDARDMNGVTPLGLFSTQWLPPCGSVLRRVVVMG